MPGKVYLVGAGPGDPELLTLKALKALKNADVVLHDALVSEGILGFIPSTAEVRDVGKRCGRKSVPQEEINQLLVNYARLGLEVVRLKGGDPLIFGRGGEEIQALRQANIEFEIIPGITAALGAAATAEIPLTHRATSSALVLLTSQHSKQGDGNDWPALSPNMTVVVYMPGHDYHATSQRLMNAGFSANTPCAVISQATSENEKIRLTTVDDLATAPQLPAPTLLIVGEVVRSAEDASRQNLALPSSFRREFVPLFADAGFTREGRPYPPEQEQPE
jgi:uroporphyrin-III C-methyltransferase